MKIAPLESFLGQLLCNYSLLALVDKLAISDSISPHAQQYPKKAPGQAI